jgi:G3E family GTPase
MTPITVLCGFLGSGKTTLLRQWRSEEAMRNAAVIVQDLSLNANLSHQPTNTTILAP